jgi:hypothetical protein
VPYLKPLLGAATGHTEPADPHNQNGPATEHAHPKLCWKKTHSKPHLTL